MVSVKTQKKVNVRQALTAFLVVCAGLVPSVVAEGGQGSASGVQNQQEAVNRGQTDETPDDQDPGESLAEAELSLGSFDEEVYRRGLLGGGPEVRNVVLSLREDHRVRRLLNGYERLGAKEARKRTLALWKAASREHKRRLEKVSSEWLSSGAYNISIGLRDSNYACAAVVLLMTRFGTDDDVRMAILSWQLAGETAANKVPSDPIVGLHPFRADAVPDGLYVVNMCLTRIRNSRELRDSHRIVREKMGIQEESITTQLVTVESQPSAVDVRMEIHYAQSWTALLAHDDVARERLRLFALDALKTDSN